MPLAPLSRRTFMQLAGAAAAAVSAEPMRGLAQATAATPRIALGLDNFAVRGMGWKAPELLDYAAQLQLDTLFISDLDAYTSLEDGYLREIKAKAESLKLALYVGSWSICPNAVRFKNNWGTAEEHLATGLRVAKTLGSPVFRVILGGSEDRKAPGGIQSRITEIVKVLKAARGRILDTGVKVAIENHAGDLHSRELVRLVEDAGPDICGVNFDSGNAAWTLEDPVACLQRLAPYTICSSLRDEQIWETPEGYAVQWTAIGDGLVDWPAFMDLWQKHCPQVPFQIETISGAQRPFPYLKPEFWEMYPEVPAQDFTRILALAKRGTPLKPFQAPAGTDKKAAEQAYQRAEVERSIKYCRETLHLGRKA